MKEHLIETALDK